LSIFTFVACAFDVLSLPSSVSWKFPPRFSFSILKVLGFLFKSLIHFALTFCIWCLSVCDGGGGEIRISFHAPV
jgi:hypothetical protein